MKLKILTIRGMIYLIGLYLFVATHSLPIWFDAGWFILFSILYWVGRAKVGDEDK